MYDLNDGKSYVLNLDAALNSPKILDIEEKPIAKTLIVPFDVYNSKLYQWEGEESDRGAAAVEISHFLSIITTKANRVKEKNNGKGFYFEYHFPSGEKIILDPRRHNCPSSSSTQRTIACAKHWGATVATCKSSVYNTAVAQDIEAHLIESAVYKGYRTVFLPYDLIHEWEKSGFTASEWEKNFPDELPLNPNEFVEFIYDKHYRPKYFKNIGMFNHKTNCLEHLQTMDKWPDGIYPASPRQAMALEAGFTDPNRLPVVIFDGLAGSGKTFLSWLVAITLTNLRKEKASDKNVYQGQSSKRRKKEKRAELAQLEMMEEMSQEELRKYAAKEAAKEASKPKEKPKSSFVYQEIWCCPPDKMMGDKMAAVKGDRWEKQRDKLDGVAHNVRAILKATISETKSSTEEGYNRDIDTKVENILRSVNITSPGQLNGDSFSDTIFILDEAEFLQLAQIRTAIERIDKNSKIIICGDPTQKRNQYGASDNSLQKAENRLKYDPGVAIIKFDKGDEVQRPGAKIIDRCWSQKK